MAVDARPYPIDPSLFGRVAVLMGGWSAEREISLRSGQAVFEALRRQGIDAVAVDVRRPQVVDALQTGGFDRAFNILHGPGGEDGVIQGVLETLEIPCTGSGVLASALAMDKLRCKQLLEGCGIPTPPWMVLEADTAPGLVEATLGLPVMVKPALEGSSIGMSKVTEAEQLAAAWETAAAHGGEVLAERWIGGREYTVAILGREALPVIALETPREFYDYAAKYEADDTRYLCPCGLDPEAERRLQRLALAAFEAVGAEGWGRVDILTEADGTPYVIELNTVPGMTDHSLVPMAAQAAGIGFDELVVRILAQTLSREVEHVRAG